MVKYRKEVYPRTVKLVPRADLYELKKTNAVAFYEEHAFHDNLEDITWFHTHMKEIAESAAKGLCEYFGKPYVEETKPAEPLEPMTPGELLVKIMNSTGTCGTWEIVK